MKKIYFAVSFFYFLCCLSKVQASYEGSLTIFTASVKRPYQNREFKEKLDPPPSPLCERNNNKREVFKKAKIKSLPR